LRWSSVSESERASGASADDRTRNCGSETRGVTLARRSRGGRVLFTLHNTFECSLGLGGGGTSFVPQFTLPVLSGSPPFWFNPRLVLSALAIGLGCDLLSPVGHCGEWSRRDGIIDNYKQRSPAWSSFLCGPEGQTFFLRRACHRPRRLRLRHGLRTQRRRRRRLHVVRRGRQTAKSQYIRRRLQLRRGRRRHVQVLARPRPHSTRPTRTLNA
jgi:hypothetical protein